MFWEESRITIVSKILIHKKSMPFLTGFEKFDSINDIGSFIRFYRKYKRQIT